MRDRWFYGVLAFATAAVVWLFSPFLYVLLFAAVVVVVTWPLFERMLRACSGRRGLAAALTVSGLLFVLFVPLGLLGYRFAQEAMSLVDAGSVYIESGGLTRGIVYVEDTAGWMPAWLTRWLPADFTLHDTIVPWLQNGARGVLNAVGNSVPALLGNTVSAGVGIAIFLLAVVSLFIEGPRLLQFVADLSPLSTDNESRLFTMFTEFANNVVVGTFATAAVQGIVAGVGYAIVGVDRVVFFAMLTGVFAFVPLVGTLVIWVPLALLTGMEHGLGWGLFLGGWGVLVSQIDNVVRPLFLRGRMNIHPLLVFLAVFGGIAWMGVTGALLGPMILVFFLALYMIYLEDHLGIRTLPGAVAETRSGLPQWMKEFVRRVWNAVAAEEPGAKGDPVGPLGPPGR